MLDKGLNAIDQIDYDDLNRVIDINQKGTMYCMSEALKVMKSGASIVNISSVAGQYGAGGAVYVSTKAAIYWGNKIMQQCVLLKKNLDVMLSVQEVLQQIWLQD